ncbi:hypothetical protein [Noviherbaspirillum sp. Root189]|uniref:hypothetical protein n=1 Tax=Noviherbaspirillum sp. Root189 TaxID=1736487 RepID=UPI00070F6EFE|nr:hypothetical protein [Noviherbaspirillum sp. Root189]KRB74243.1 hypothetical protein ASE07_26720 [Noviherbaspirillum sp. Root189]
MSSLPTLKAACVEALDAIDNHRDWHEPYCALVDPGSVLALIQQLDALAKAATADELQCLGKLIRDLTGYIKMVAGDKPDPVRDDLLLHARQVTQQLGL